MHGCSRQAGKQAQMEGGSERGGLGELALPPPRGGGFVLKGRGGGRDLGGSGTGKKTKQNR